MPEAKDWMARGGGGGAFGELAGGFFISRALSPAVLAAAAGRRKVRTFSAEENKENIPPLGLARRRKSPLPSWYPRTPLQDITAIINALEKRRARIQAARAQQRNLNAELSPQISLLTSPFPQEQIPCSQGCSSDVSDSSPSSMPISVINSPSPTQFQSSSTPTPTPTPTSNSPTLQTPSVSADLTPTGLKPTEPLQMCSSMDDIERAVKVYLKKSPKVPTKKTVQRRTLMSMR